MTRMGIYDQIETAFQDLVAPALHELRGEIYAIRGDIEGLRSDVRRVDGKVDSVQARMGSMKHELIRARPAALEARRA